MKDSYTLTAGLLTSWGKALLVAAFGVSLIRAMRGEKDLHVCFERLTIAVLFMTFYNSWASGLDSLSTSLVSQLRRFGNEDSLKEVVLAGLERAGKSPPGRTGGLNVGAMIEQAWRSGIWGVLEGIVEFLFLTVDLLIECGREVLWKLVLVLFPLGCGVFPALPRIMTNMSFYLVELALWTPLLFIVRSTTGAVAKVYLNRDGSIGLYIVGVEIVAILLILSIPKISHRLMSGAFTGDFDTGSSMFRMGRRIVLRGVSR